MSKLPPLIPLLRWAPYRAGAYPKTGLIESVDDLPSRLFLGDRRTDSFRQRRRGLEVPLPWCRTRNLHGAEW